MPYPASENEPYCGCSPTRRVRCTRPLIKRISAVGTDAIAAIESCRFRRTIKQERAAQIGHQDAPVLNITRRPQPFFHLKHAHPDGDESQFP